MQTGTGAHGPRGDVALDEGGDYWGRRPPVSNSNGKHRLRGDDRGQTLQDYLVGISVFLVVVFVAMGFFPNLINNFQTGSLGDHEAQADRIGRQIVTNNSTPGAVNELDATSLYDTVMDRPEAELRTQFGLRDTANINVTVESLDGTTYVEMPSGNHLASQPGYFDNPAGTTARIITLSGVDSDQCDPACRLVVRVW